ncbi:hypothetical protein [Paraburkholderia fungorum]
MHCFYEKSADIAWQEEPDETRLRATQSPESSGRPKLGDVPPRRRLAAIIQVHATVFSVGEADLARLIADNFGIGKQLINVDEQVQPYFFRSPIR